MQIKCLECGTTAAARARRRLNVDWFGLMESGGGCRLSLSRVCERRITPRTRVVRPHRAGASLDESDEGGGMAA